MTYVTRAMLYRDHEHDKQEPEYSMLTIQHLPKTYGPIKTGDAGAWASFSDSRHRHYKGALVPIYMLLTEWLPRPY